MNPAVQSRRPQPVDFHITEADIQRYDERERRLENLEWKAGLALGPGTVAIVGIVQIDWRWFFSAGPLSFSTYFGIIGLIASWFFLSFLCFLPAALLVLPFTKFLLNRTPHAEAVRRYKSSVIQFRHWLERSRESWWKALDGRNFEIELARLFRAMGWRATATKASGDGGIDIVGVRNATKFVAQCKNHKKTIGPAVVRELYGTLLASDAKYAILASISGFTIGAKDFAKGKPIRLIDLEWILANHMNLDPSWTSVMHPNPQSPRISVRLRRSN